MATNNNSKRSPRKLHIRTGDKVMAISGDDKGRTGTVVQVFPAKNRAIVEGLRMVTKHVKATQTNEGGLQQVEASIHISNLMVVDPKSGEPTRIGRKKVGEKNVRFSKKSGEII